jgi:hyperosmotically inducible periplasmic protein
MIKKGFAMKTPSIFLGTVLILSACASTPPSPDVQMASRIKQEIVQAEGSSAAKSLNVESSQGIVILSGFTETEKQKQDAAEVALRVSGVQQVFNNIQVRNQASGQ